MNHLSGRCANVDYCSLADARQMMGMDTQGEAYCPECARVLVPPPGKAPGIVRPALAGIGFICITGALIYTGLASLHPAHADAVSRNATLAALPHPLSFAGGSMTGPLPIMPVATVPLAPPAARARL